METNKRQLYKDIVLLSYVIRAKNRETPEYNLFFKKILNYYIAELKSSSENGKTLEKKNTNYLVDQLNYLKTSESATSALRHLHNEMKYYQELIIRSNINNGNDWEDHEKLIESVIKPLIQIWEKELKLEKELPTEESSKHYSKVEKLENKEPELLLQKNIETILQVSSITANQNLKLPIDFAQINCSGSKEQIAFFFSILAKENNPSNERPYMNQKDVDELLEKNFLIFCKVPTGKYFDLNLTQRQKGVLKCFILEFYEKYELGRIGSKLKYVDFLIWNFELFKNDNRVTLNKSMNKSKKPSQNNRIQIAKYTPKN